MAKSPKTYKTRIGTPTTDVDRLLLRGKDTLNDLVGKVSFTECTFLAVTGRMPSLQQTRILDACLVILMDHGITPSALVSRLALSTRGYHVLEELGTTPGVTYLKKVVRSEPAGSHGKPEGGHKA